jgi:hypothetical protein
MQIHLDPIITKWAQDKPVALDEDLKFTLCENYMMDEDKLVERSSEIAADHPLIGYVARVRADCIINEYDQSIDSGTSYAAPMVAGAMAASGNMDAFQKALHGEIMTANSLASLSTQTEKVLTLTAALHVAQQTAADKVEVLSRAKQAEDKALTEAWRKSTFTGTPPTLAEAIKAKEEMENARQLVNKGKQLLRNQMLQN